MTIVMQPGASIRRKQLISSDRGGMSGCSRVREEQSYGNKDNLIAHQSSRGSVTQVLGRDERNDERLTGRRLRNACFATASMRIDQHKMKASRRSREPAGLRSQGKEKTAEQPTDA